MFWHGKGETNKCSVWLCSGPGPSVIALSPASVVRATNWRSQTFWTRHTGALAWRWWRRRRVSSGRDRTRPLMVEYFSTYLHSHVLSSLKLEFWRFPGNNERSWKKSYLEGAPILSTWVSKTRNVDSQSPSLLNSLPSRKFIFKRKIYLSISMGRILKSKILRPQKL